MSFSIKHKTTSVAGKVPQPADIERGELAVNLADKKLFTKDQNDAIVELGGDGAAVHAADTPPAQPKQNQLWWKSDSGQLLLYYSDGTSNQWVEAALSGFKTPGVPKGATAPASPAAGDLWVDTTTPAAPVLKSWNGTAWEVVGGSIIPTGTATPAGAPPTAPKAGDIYEMTSLGPFAAAWTGLSDVRVEQPGALVKWDGANWIRLGGGFNATIHDDLKCFLMDVEGGTTATWFTVTSQQPYPVPIIWDWGDGSPLERVDLPASTAGDFGRGTHSFGGHTYANPAQRYTIRIFSEHTISIQPDTAKIKCLGPMGRDFPGIEYWLFGINLNLWAATPDNPPVKGYQFRGLSCGENIFRGCATPMFINPTSCPASFLIGHFADNTRITGIVKISAGRFPSAVVLADLFSGCTGITMLNVELPAATSINGMARGCTGLTQFNGRFSSGLVAASELLLNCSKLSSTGQTFVAGRIGYFRNCFDWSQAFDGCALPVAEVDKIINFISRATSGAGIPGTLGISGGTNAQPSAASANALLDLRNRGWTVTTN